MIAVVDYGAGNLRSVTNLLDSIDANYRVIESADGLLGASHIILPGVGNFAQICSAFDRLQIRESIVEAIRSGTPYLGICLGMQVLFEKSDEAPGQKGLGVLAGSVNKLDTTARIPHMGWNTLDGDWHRRFVTLARISTRILRIAIFAQSTSSLFDQQRRGAHFLLLSNMAMFLGCNSTPRNLAHLVRR